jgi:hypothetical protein
MSSITHKESKVLDVLYLYARSSFFTILRINYNVSDLDTLPLGIWPHPMYRIT